MFYDLDHKDFKFWGIHNGVEISHSIFGGVKNGKKN
jgi:hypothetical protein